MTSPTLSRPKTPPRPRQRRQWWRPARRQLTAVGFILPALAVYVVFLLYPLARSLWGSLFTWNGLDRGDFAGVGNFARLLSGRNLSVVGNAFVHNALWFCGIMLVQNVLGLLIAYTLYQRGRRYTFFQSVFFFPAVLSPVIVGALWRLLLAPNGPAQSILATLGLYDGTLSWLGDSDKALWVLIGIDVWNWVGLPILVFLAAFRGIPPEVFEAARLDGAGGLRILVQVAVPLLLPAVSSLTTLTVINSFNQFDIVYVIEGVQGNPSGSTDVLVTYFYRLAFGSEGAVGLTDIGLSLALGTLLFLFLVACSLAAIRYFNRKAMAL